MMKYDVIIATYNGERYLADQLESILGQSVPPTNVFIRDDSSTDNTLVVLEEFSRINPSVRVFRGNTRMGYIKNFEFLVKECVSEIVFFCDQDDVWVHEKAGILLNAFKESCTTKCIFSNAYLVDEALVKFGTLLNSGGSVPTDIDGLLYENKATGATLACSLKFLKNDCIPFCPTVPHDYWIATIAAKIDALRYIDIPLIFYRQHGGNQIGARQPSVLKRAISALSIAGFRRRVERQNYRYTLLKSLDLESQTSQNTLDYIGLLNFVYRKEPQTRKLFLFLALFGRHGVKSLLVLFDFVVARGNSIYDRIHSKS